MWSVNEDPQIVDYIAMLSIQDVDHEFANFPHMANNYIKFSAIV